jgi:CHASE2 domain-containing sensor protein
MALPVLAGAWLLLSPLGQLFALWSFDLLFLFRPDPDPAALGGVVILAIDEESYGALRQNPNRPWDRGVHERLVRELAARRAKLVVFDVLFDEPSPDPKADGQFAAAIRDYGRVVLAASVQQGRGEARPASSRLLRPFGALGASAPWGVVEWPVDAGSELIIRRQFNHLEYTNLAWQAAALERPPADRLAQRWLNYYGPGGTLPIVSYHRALETNALPDGFFAGKAVFVGKAGVITANGQDLDYYATPFALWNGSRISGVELQATAFLNLVRREWLEELPPAAELLVLLLLGALAGFGLARLRPWPAVVVALGGAVAVAAGTIVLAWTRHRWFPWLIPCTVQIPVALGWALYSYTQRLVREKTSLEQTIALAESTGNLPALLGAGTRTTRTSAAGEAGLPALRPAAAGAAPPPPIPNHQLLRCIGRGSYGEVWLARDEIGTYHAVKVVYQRSFSSAAPYDREFRGIQKFTPISRSHPGFVHILHVGRNDPEGYFFYIMELGDDEHSGPEINPATYSPKSLAKQLEQGRLPLAACVQLGLDLAAALDYLHRQQLVHRDIKPSNIIFARGVPKFADIGLVTDLSARGQDASLVGTEGYLAPEGPGAAAADIYSLGKVLYEACTGRDRREFPSLPGTLVESSSPAFAAWNEVVLKACDPEVKHRYQSVAEMQADLLKVRKLLNG